MLRDNVEKGPMRPDTLRDVGGPKVQSTVDQGVAGQAAQQNAGMTPDRTMTKEELDMRTDLYRRREYLSDELQKVYETFDWLNSDDAKKQFRINDAMTRATARARD